MTEPRPDIQLIANAVMRNRQGHVLLTRDDDADRWWLPGTDLALYEHPDEACARLLDELGIAGRAPAGPHHIESFRGRRGWHVMFNYAVDAGDAQAPAGSAWFAPDALPRTAHGAWESGVVAKVIAG